MRMKLSENMFRYIIVLSIFLFVVGFLKPLYAVEVENLYSAKVEINSQTSRDRKRGLEQAMRAVLLKVGGQDNIFQSSEIKSALRNVSSFLKAYRYERSLSKNLLVVSFDEQKINQLFEDNNFAIWGRFRPQVLLWMVQEQGLERKVISELADSTLTNVVREHSEKQGLPIIMPLMDLTDNVSVNVADIWGRFALPIQQASNRYFPESIIIVRLSDVRLADQNELVAGLNEISQHQNTVETGLQAPYIEQVDTLTELPVTDESCQSESTENVNDESSYSDEKQLLGNCTTQYALDWSFISDANNTDVEGSAVQTFSAVSYGEEPESLLIKALDEIREIIYQKYALTTDTNNSYVIDVANVDSLATHMAIERFLSQASGVKSFQLLQVNGEMSRFQLNLIGSQQAMLASLKLNQKLKQYIDPLADVNADAVPVFYWEP